MAGDYVYIAEYGEVYHTCISCPGLTRNVHRVRLSEIGGVPPCERCSQ